MNLTQFANLDFADTAAVLAHLDLVIAVDTAVVHLAGGLGRPVWTLLPYAADWRWLLNRQDSPWYPSMRLFRQDRPGDWSGPVARAAAALRALQRGLPATRLPLSRPSEQLPPFQSPAPVMPSAEELLRQGAPAFQAGRREEALAHFQRATALWPDSAPAHYNLGVALQQTFRLGEAIASYRRALHINPNAAEVHYNLANALRDRGELAEAVICYRQALTLRPDYGKALTNLGTVLRHLGCQTEAVDCYRRMVEIEPARPAAHENLGIVLLELGQPIEAIAALERALALQPGSPTILARLGAALLELGRGGEAVVRFRQALALCPDSAEGYCNLACALVEEQGPNPEALVLFRQALLLNPQLVQAHMGLAGALLAAGDLAEGFAEYEWRWQPGTALPRVPGPIWDGAPHRDQTILLWAEQGLGDAIQFIRFAPLVAERFGRVVVGCPKALVRLLATAPGVACVSACADTLPSFDCHAPLASLPHLLGTTLTTIPGQVPYLHPPEKAVQLPAPSATAVRKVGIAWATGHPARADGRRRSCPWEHFVRILAVPGVVFYSLQKGPRAVQLGQDRPAGTEVQDLDNLLDDLADTASAVSQLDLVITVDTAIAHLAGALGKPTWVLLPFVADWRWLWGRQDSPWYSSLRLFRQDRPCNWEGLINQVAAALSSSITDFQAQGQ